MKKAIRIVCVLTVAAITSAFAQKPSVVTTNEEGWMKIGEITADFKMQNESIVILAADEFESIKLKVTDAPINIERLEVFYESGDKEEIEVNDELQAGGETRVIDLKEPERDIQKVAFTYKTLPNYKGEKAHVELHGLKTQRQGKDYEDEAKRDEDDPTVGEGLRESSEIIEAEIKDKVYADKVGPNGEVVYIDKHSKYYYITKKGNKVYATKAQLKDKPKDE